jgi:hypothetical protein
MDAAVGGGIAIGDGEVVVREGQHALLGYQRIAERLLREVDAEDGGIRARRGASAGGGEQQQHGETG